MAKQTLETAPHPLIRRPIVSTTDDLLGAGAFDPLIKSRRRHRPREGKFSYPWTTNPDCDPNGRWLREAALGDMGLPPRRLDGAAFPCHRPRARLGFRTVAWLLSFGVDQAVCRGEVIAQDFASNRASIPVQLSDGFLQS